MARPKRQYREEVALTPPMPPAAPQDSTDRYLDIWAAWMRHRGVHLGYPSRATGIRYTVSKDFEEMVDAADDAVAQVVDAAVDGLPYMQRCAIAVRYRLMFAWPDAFGAYAYAEVLSQARDQVRRFLVARGLE